MTLRHEMDSLRDSGVGVSPRRLVVMTATGDLNHYQTWFNLSSPLLLQDQLHTMPPPSLRFRCEVGSITVNLAEAHPDAAAEFATFLLRCRRDGNVIIFVTGIRDMRIVISELRKRMSFARSTESMCISCTRAHRRRARRGDRGIGPPGVGVDQCRGEWSDTPDAAYSIDCGFEKVRYVDEATRVLRMIKTPISKAPGASHSLRQYE